MLSAVRQTRSRTIFPKVSAAAPRESQGAFWKYDCQLNRSRVFSTKLSTSASMCERRRRISSRSCSTSLVGLFMAQSLVPWLAGVALALVQTQSQQQTDEHADAEADGNRLGRPLANHFLSLVVVVAKRLHRLLRRLLNTLCGVLDVLAGVLDS